MITLSSLLRLVCLIWDINPGSCTSGKHELTSLTKHLPAVILKRLGCVDSVDFFAACNKWAC